MLQRCCSVFLLAAVLPAVASQSCDSAAALKVSVAASGAYRIPASALRQAIGCDTLATDHLRLSNQGRPVRYTVAKPSGDLLFVGRHLGGAQSYYSEFSAYNTYWLMPTGSADAPGPVASDPVTSDPASSGEPHTRQAAALRLSRRIEKDQLRVRFRGTADAPQPEVWYWARLNSIDPEPLVIPLDLRYRSANSVPSIRLGLRGWSKLAGRGYADLPDHRIEVSLNGHPVASAEWLDQEEHILEIQSVPVNLLKGDGSDRLSLRIPERTPPGETRPLVDAVLLNWIALEYEHQGLLSDGQQRFQVKHQPGGWFQLSGPTERPPTVISDQGRLLTPFSSTQHGGRHWHRYATHNDATAYIAVAEDGFYTPAAVVADQPSELRRTEQSADYLMISHRRLRAAIEPLAAFHRQRGLEVRVVDVEDIYDEFNHGVLAPSAIRDFISHAYHHWQSPRLRFVLLVGDASWDVHSEAADDRNYADWTFRPNERTHFAKNQSHGYQDDIAATQRNLIPTWPVETYQGYAASDNVFVAVDGDDFWPDLAIGRFPVSDPADVSAIVDKVIAYHRQAEVGPWRRKVLWVANEQLGLQRTSDRLDNALAQAGYAGTKVYPSPEEKDNAEHQATLQSAFDGGQLLVHFMGHGGRYVWRTGPPDIRKNHDLFTLDHLEQLKPTTRLPFIMSMTCYSAPFDHPTADSIGEKFLRLPDRGAIGILAASWRNSPGHHFSRVVLDELTRHPANTLGEAVMRAKHQEKSRLMVETYNLLGDPATRLALPNHTIKLKIKERPDTVQVKGRVLDAAFDGQVVIDWQDSKGRLVKSEQFPLRRGRFNWRASRDPGQDIGAIRAYAWNAQQNVDAIGGIARETQGATRAAGRQTGVGAPGRRSKP